MHILKLDYQQMKFIHNFICYMFKTFTQEVVKILVREKGRDLTQSYDKSPYTDRKIKKSNVVTPTRNQKLRLQNNSVPTYDGQLG